MNLITYQKSPLTLTKTSKASPAQLLIFRTSIATMQQVRVVKKIFKNQAAILDWWVDIEDIDNVLRIEATENLEENDIINLLACQGFYCEVLPD